MPSMRSMVALVATAVMGTGLATVPITPAAAVQNDSVPGSTATSWQTNGVVRAIAYANGIVYLGGEFTSVRPPGAASGTGEVARNHFAAFSSSTGALITSINHDVSGTVQDLATSSDGATVYLGGDFTSVDGQTRNRVAALSVSGNGSLLPWAPSVDGRVNGIAATASTVYLVGSFGRVGTVGAKRVAAVNASTGALRAGFSAHVDDSTIYDVGLSKPGDKLYLAGGFSSVNGDPSARSAAALDATTGALLPLPAGSVIPVSSPACKSEMKTVRTDTDSVYFGAEGTGGGCFDGTFAARTSDGSLKWQSQCLGATQGIEVLHGLLYTAEHSHDCSADQGFDPDAFPEIGWSKGLARHLLARSTTDGKVSSWYPNTNGGTGGALGPRVFGTDGTQLFVGGEFTTVNGAAQQGFTRFSPTVSTAAPARPAAPVAVARPGGAVSVFVQSPLDVDDTDLLVRVYRDGGSTPIGSVPAHALFWRDPVVSVHDDALAAGTTHTYTADAVEANGTLVSTRSPASNQVTVAATVPSYPAAVLADSPSLFWRVGERSGPVAADTSASLAGGTYSGGVSYGVVGQGTDSDRAISTDGISGLLSSSAAAPSPAAFSVEAWIKTTTTTGGKILGFGNRQGGLDFAGNPALSNSYDKHLYMTNDGRLAFGVYTGNTEVLASSQSYNDGQWHHVVGTQGASGMAFYVDGVRLGRNSVANNQSYQGYWRVGGDNLNGWPGQPSSSFFAGTIDDVAVYPTALSKDAVLAHFAASGRAAPPATSPTDAYGRSVVTDQPLSFWRLDETSGSTAADSSDNGLDATYVGTVTQGAAGALNGFGRAATFDGASGGVVSTAGQSGPSRYATELWFSTSTTRGGKLIGFGDAQTGNSSSYDKQVYLTNDGRLIFGVYNGGFDTITSAPHQNDGSWHHVVAMQGPAGMALYLDDVLVGTNGATSNQGYGGYWRVGGDNLAFWPDQPDSNYLDGTIDEVAIYDGPLSAAQVDSHYLASGRTGPDTTAPTTAITSPADQDTLAAGTVPVTATASDARGVASVDLTVDGAVVDTSTTSPYRFSWTAAAGSHTLTTVARDAAGNAGTSAAVHVTVTLPDTTAPTTAITSPVGGDTVYGPTTVVATADDDTAVTSVALRVDGTTVGTDTSAPYAFSWNATAVGSHSLVTVATDAAGNTGTSAPVVVTVAVPPDTTAPTVPTALTATAVGTARIDLAWHESSDDRGVAGYRVVRDGSVLPGLVTGTTFSDTGLAPASSHSYTVRAEDAAGNSSADSAAATASTAPAQTVLYTDSWPGANGAGWAAAWTGGASNGTVSTQSGAGALAVNDVSGAYARAQLTGAAAATDTDVVFSYRFSPTGPSAYADVFLRGSGGWQNSYRPRTGYGIELSSSSGTVSTLRNVNGTVTTLGTVAGAQQVTTAKQWVRLRVTGTTVRFHVWLDGTDEPTTWTSYSDSSIASAGQLFISTNRGSSNTGAKSFSIDDLTLTQIAP